MHKRLHWIHKILYLLPYIWPKMNMLVRITTIELISNFGWSLSFARFGVPGEMGNIPEFFFKKRKNEAQPPGRF